MAYHPHSSFITLNSLPIFVMIMAALGIFQAWIWVLMGIGKFLIELCVTNIVDKKLHGLHLAGWLAVSLHYCGGLNVVMK